MRQIAACILVGTLLSSVLLAAPPSADAEKVWSLEEAYWKHVKANDLVPYIALWHRDFLGWLSVNSGPVRKDQITGWITAHTSKGEKLESYELERLTIQATDNVVTTTYRARYSWTGPGGPGQPVTVRIIHTWLRNPGGNWQIISGMSCPANAEGH